ELSIHNANVWTRVASGNTSKTNATLGSIDITMLAASTYDLRLQAYDSFGNVSTTMRQVILNNTQPVGNPHFKLTDVAIQLAGVPITVTRSYDSANRVNGDFGVDWSLDTTTGTMRSEVTNVPGDGWDFDNAGPSCHGLFGTRDCCDFGGDGTLALKSHKITV